ncbi:FMN-linked oxidoreductase [Colletotrichum somersetense]|nr:FMN-linked oxidoreductase [Colletotrichum somersetense]
MSLTVFTPVSIANGRIALRHRVIMASMTRNRGVPLAKGTAEKPNRIWLPDASGMPGVPGMFHPSQIDGWKHVVRGFYGKGGFIYAQLASATPWDDEDKFPFRDPVTKEKISYMDHPPRVMSLGDMNRTIADFVTAARTAIEVGFDGVEINSGNGNLLDQFLHSNNNTRTDAYGGSPKKRARFPLDLLSAVANAIGPSNVDIRLEPTGIYNHTRGTERDTPAFTCGGWDSGYFDPALERGWDAVAFAKWFVSNPDSPARLMKGALLHAYDRSRFYASWDGVRETGYVDYLTFEDEAVVERGKVTEK